MKQGLEGSSSVMVRKSARKSFWLAMGTAGVMLAGGGATDRWLAARLDRVGRAPELGREALARLPLQLGEWMGREVRLDPTVVRATDTDECITRLYARPGSHDAVSLFVAVLVVVT